MPNFRVIEVETRANEFCVQATSEASAIKRLQNMNSDDREKFFVRSKQIDVSHQIEE